jgi:hypothetical protein
MEDTEPPRRPSRQDEVEFSDAPAYSRRSGFLQPAQPMMNSDIDVAGKPQVVYLCDHQGSRYVFPFDRLRSYEVGTCWCSRVQVTKTRC